MEEIKKLFVEASGKNPQDSLAKVKKSTIQSIVDRVNKQYGTNADGKKIAKLSSCFLIEEMPEVIKEYPHLHKRQVIRLFEQQCLTKKVARLDSSAITRPYLIDLVESLEDYTGMKMTDDSDAPLAYLDQKCGTLDIEDIGDFFSGREDARIRQIIKAMKCIKTLETDKYQEGASRETVKNFLDICCGMKLDEKAPISSMKPESLPDGDRPHYMVVYWAECKFDKVVPNDFVESKTIGELIDILAGK